MRLLGRLKLLLWLAGLCPNRMVLGGGIVLGCLGGLMYLLPVIPSLFSVVPGCGFNVDVLGSGEALRFVGF